MYIRLLNLPNNHCWQYYNITITFSSLLSLVILFSVIPINFIVSGVKSSKYYPVLILNVILFSILFTYIIIEGLSILSPGFFEHIQNNLEYLI